MKRFKLLLIAVALFGGLNFAQAQSKIAHINVEELMTKHPDMEKAQKQLQTIAATYDTEFQAMYTEFISKRDKYIAEEQTAGDKVNEERSIELQGMQKSIEDYRVEAQKKLSEKELELKKPILEKTLEAIKKVAKAKGFEYVLDSSNGSGVLMAEGPNILADVKKDLGIK